MATLPEDPQAPSRWLRFVTAYGMITTAALFPYLPDLMASTGLKGGILTAGFLAPMLLTALVKLRTLRDRRLIPIMLLIGHVVVSTAWSGHTLDGGIKSFAALTSFMWTAMFLTHPTLIDVALRWAFRYCLAASALNVAGVTAVPMPSYLVAIFGLFGLLHRTLVRQEAAAATPQLQWKVVAQSMLYIAVIFFSTFRAPTIGAVVGVLLTAARIRESRWTFAFVVLAGVLFFTFAPRAEGTYSGEVDRHDLIGRYTTAN